MSGWGELSLTSAWNWDWSQRPRWPLSLELVSSLQSLGSRKAASQLRWLGSSHAVGCRGWVRAVTQVSTAGGGANHRASTEAKEDPDLAFGAIGVSLSCQSTADQFWVGWEDPTLPSKKVPPPTLTFPATSLWACSQGTPFWATHVLIPRGKPWPLRLDSPPLTTAFSCYLQTLSPASHPLPSPSAIPLPTCCISSFSTLPSVPPDYSNIHSFFCSHRVSLSFPIFCSVFRLHSPHLWHLNFLLLLFLLCSRNTSFMFLAVITASYYLCVWVLPVQPEHHTGQGLPSSLYSQLQAQLLAYGRHSVCWMNEYFCYFKSSFVDLICSYVYFPLTSFVSKDLFKLFIWTYFQTFKKIF